MIRYWFIYSLGKVKDITQVKLLQFSVEKLGQMGMQTWIGYCLHARFTTCIICILRNSAYVLFKLILKLSDEFEIMLST